MNPTVYRASPIYVLLATLLFIGAAYGFYWLASSGYIVVAEFRRSLRFLNIVPADIKVFACYFATGFSAFTAIAIARFLIDDRVVIVDDQSIEVRYALWSKKAYWGDFKAIKPVPGSMHLKFHSGPRTVPFPALKFSPNRKELTMDVLSRVVEPDANRSSGPGNIFTPHPTTAIPVPSAPAAPVVAPVARVHVEDQRRAFGKRTAA